MFGLEKFGIKLGIGELIELAGNPDKALKLLQKGLDSLWDSPKEEAEALAKQVLPSVFPAYNVDVEIDVLDEKTIAIFITKKTVEESQ